MSTRAMVIIKDQYRSLYFYRHSDGYPSGTLPTLEKFLNYVKEGKIRDNVSQAAGWLILIGAEEYDKYWDNSFSEGVAKQKTKSKEEVLNPIKDWKCGAYEPCSSNDTSFIDYVYTIDLCKKIIEVKNNNENKE